LACEQSYYDAVSRESSLLAIGGVIMGLIIGVLATMYFNVKDSM